MKTVYIFIVFVVVALTQAFVPLQMIWKQENVIKSGKVYKFKTRPIDPTDPFRGKYITLRYEMNSFVIKDKDQDLKRGDEIRVYLDTDIYGFAVVNQLSVRPLDIKKDYVIAKVISHYDGNVRFKLPFDIFYMEETKAKDAEMAYTKVNRDTLKQNVYSLVYVKDGRSVLNDVIIDGQSIQDYVDK